MLPLATCRGKIPTLLLSAPPLDNLNIYLMGKWKIKEQCSLKIILTVLFRIFFSSSQYSRILNFIFIYFFHRFNSLNFSCIKTLMW